jgi:23S rRNA (cytosine1962-C5)-methyltransferase
VLTAYAVKASSLTLYYALQAILEKFPGQIEVGEVILNEQSAGRLISCAVFARWAAE